MLWPVWIDSEPMLNSWRIGQVVSGCLAWWDDPPLGPEHTLQGNDFDSQLYLGPDGEPRGQLLTRGQLTAVRHRHVEVGMVRLSGCLSYDRYAWLTTDQCAPSAGTVKAVRAVQHLRQRAKDSWEYLPGRSRTEAVPSTAVEHLGSDPPLSPTRSDEPPPAPGSLEVLSESEYLRRTGHLLPRAQWHARGFLVQLDNA